MSEWLCQNVKKLYQTLDYLFRTRMYGSVYLRKRKPLISSRQNKYCHIEQFYLEKDTYFFICQEKCPYLLFSFYKFDGDLSHYVQMLSLNQETETLQEIFTNICLSSDLLLRDNIFYLLQNAINIM